MNTRLTRASNPANRNSMLRPGETLKNVAEGAGVSSISLVSSSIDHEPPSRKSTRLAAHTPRETVELCSATIIEYLYARVCKPSQVTYLGG